MDTLSATSDIIDVAKSMYNILDDDHDYEILINHDLLYDWRLNIEFIDNIELLDIVEEINEIITSLDEEKDDIGSSFTDYNLYKPILLSYTL